MRITDVPVFCNVLYLSRHEAIQATKGDIHLTFCQRCGHVFNSAFDPAKITYSEAYENSLHFSSRFQEYALSLAKKLIDKYHLHRKNIIDIGCGKGDFLKMLCVLGDNRGVGFDTSYEDDRISGKDESSFYVIKELYSEKHTAYKADFVACRHVLEHIQFPQEFLNMVRRTIGPPKETVIFFEVPNVLYTLKDLGIWDLIYEHCGYFSETSLSYLFRSCNFIPHNVEVVFGGQFICIEAFPGDNSFIPKKDDEEYRNSFSSYVDSFHDRYYRKLNEWYDKIVKFRKRKEKIVVWGAGSKGITFLNTIKVGNEIEYVVDLNPHKHDKFVPGAGQKIITPYYLKKYRPEKIIVMNPIYKEEIQSMVDQFGLHADLLTV
jgi:hypothetical protein